MHDFALPFNAKGPGTQDGTALPDQVAKVKQIFTDRIFITNGNAITYDDVVKNRCRCQLLRRRQRAMGRLPTILQKLTNRIMIRHP